MEEEQIPDLNPAYPPLKPKHERFCHEYLKDFNATAAAKRSGYTAKGAQVAGSRILDMPAVQEYLRKEQDRMNGLIDLASSAVNKDLLGITYLNRGEFLDEAGNLRNLKDLPEEMRAAVQVSTKKIMVDDKVTTITTYSLFNKIQMMEKIAMRQPKRPKGDNDVTEEELNIANLGGGKYERI